MGRCCGASIRGFTRQAGIGPQGNQGPAGSGGGEQGAQGNQGVAGAAGAPGGPQGNQGNQGLAGAAGSPGSLGPQGNQGLQGVAGTAGAAGAAGPQGNVGNQGNLGNQGSVGATGTAGAAGPQGNLGNQGWQGGGAALDQTLVDFLLAEGFNRPPVSVDQTAEGPDTTVQFTGNILDGAYDPDGDPFFLQSLTYKGEPQSFEGSSFITDFGTAFFLPNGDWTFTPGANARALLDGETGVEVFRFTIADGKGGLSTSTLTITIHGVDSAPIVESVNDSAPLNNDIVGNMLFRYAFAWEPLPLQIINFTIDGVAGTHSPGTPVTIPSVGDLLIEANGDYTFTPVTDFVGAVNLVRYVVGYGGPTTTGFLTLAIDPLISGDQPVVLYTDIISGPTSGGEDDQGAYLSIFGKRFGDSGDLGTTTKVYIGGAEVARYFFLDDAVTVDKTGVQRIAVQVGSLGGATQGVPIHITVVTADGTSNASTIFIPNPGRMIFASLSGDDSTGTPGEINLPYRHLQLPNRFDGGIYPILRAGDCVVIRGGNWSDLGYDTCWLRFRDPEQQGFTPDGTSGSGWINFMSYPGEDVHYTTTALNRGGFEGPGEAFAGTTGDYVSVSNIRVNVEGGASGAAAPVNMQSTAGHWRIVNNNFGPWVAGNSSSLNAASVTGAGNRVYILGNYIHDIEGTTALQNHGIYGGTSAYGWVIAYNWIENCVGGSCVQFNDSDGGTGVLNTPEGRWDGFTNIRIFGNWMEVSAKYGITFSDVGAYAGTLDFRAWNNVIIGTGHSPLRLNTTTKTSDCLYAFNTVYDCNRSTGGAPSGVLHNEGIQDAPDHSIKAYDNIFSMGPNTAPGTEWLADFSGQSSGYDLKRNLYYAAGLSPSPPNDILAIIANPRFVDPAASDYTLQGISPAINAATQPMPSGVVIIDDYTALDIRLYGGAPDIGAYELPQDTPFAIVSPAVSGGPQVGVETTVTSGTWGNSPDTIEYQWVVGGVDVVGATTNAYTPVAADVRQLLQVKVIATNSSGPPTIVTITSGTIAQGAGGPTNTVAPVVSGTLVQGQTLSVTNGTWTGTVDSYSYQWLRDGVAIPGATSSTYVLVTADVGAHMSANVFAENSTTGSGIATSNTTSAVQAPPADPQVVQEKALNLTSGSTSVTLDSAVSANNLICVAIATWDNSPGNADLSDNMGHTTGNFVDGAVGTPSGTDNPRIQWRTIKLTSSGTYTLTVNTNGAAGGRAIVIEVTGQDLTSALDIPIDTADGTSTSPSLTASQPTTRPLDLVLVHISAKSTTATISQSGAFTVNYQGVGNYQKTAILIKKESSTETFTADATLDENVVWIMQSLVVKGS